MRLNGTVPQWSAAILLTATTAACGPGPGVHTGEPPVPTGVTATTSLLPTPTNNLHLANAADYFVESGAHGGYYFASPSGRWRCAIVPHTQAGCQPTRGSTLNIPGAPETVRGADGTVAVPNTIVVGTLGEAHFAVLEKGEFSPGSGAAKALPFVQVLDAAGFRCNFQKSVGVSCVSETTAKGFTFSVDGYTLHYTDVPEDPEP
ncbi:hypothetical protein MB901379_02618 [Mycobacterium basiliense]|uniref:Lipoprotein n=1 Tax=Mycobacterium basiliense TaxID=2094119 RepID=A0A3S4CC96_9MYCO|nr:hypothetical protein [Mycobacterium basiliense]VDM89051.1 hypothetical protein MB901379_02618 [Mycobacterium basiliense]